MRPACRNAWAKPHPVRQRSRTAKSHDFHHTGAGLAPTPPAACAGHVLLVNLSWGSGMQLSEAILFDLSWLFFGAWAHSATSEHLGRLQKRLLHACASP